MMTAIEGMSSDLRPRSTLKLRCSLVSQLLLCARLEESGCLDDWKKSHSSDFATSLLSSQDTDPPFVNSLDSHPFPSSEGQKVGEIPGHFPKETQLHFPVLGALACQVPSLNHFLLSVTPQPRFGSFFAHGQHATVALFHATPIRNIAVSSLSSDPLASLAPHNQEDLH